jgi:hypothetical protein
MEGNTMHTILSQKGGAKKAPTAAAVAEVETKT